LANTSCIRVWTRDNIPDCYRRFASFYEDGEVENTVFVAHVPAAVLEDRLLKLCVSASGPQSYIWWESRSLFGANQIDTFPDPDGDGLIIVGGWF